MEEPDKSLKISSSSGARRFFGVLVLLVGLLLIGECLTHELNSEKIQLPVGVITSVVGILMFLGRLPSRIGKWVVFDEVRDPIPEQSLPPPETPRQELTKEQKEEKQHYANQLRLPDKDASASAFHLLDESLALRPTPCADPMTPMYMLDSTYRIIDWNDAFTLAFDRTLEGRRGQSVMEWVYFLENYKEVLKHAVDTFSDTDNLPNIDVETIKYTSLSYGKLSARKRAYNIPDDNGECSGWLVTMELQFDDRQKKSYFYQDLLKRLQYSLMWSEYALSYDAVLNNTNVYPELIDTLIGTSDPDLNIPAKDARILDLGAGTGNITQRLADTGDNRLIVALDNNQMMLNILRSKCHKYLRMDSGGPGVIATRQDISSLFGLKENYFDYVFLNNVLYSLHESHVSSCLEEVFRVLKPGGEVRVSGPKKTAKLDVLFKRIKMELEDNGKFDMVRGQYEHVLEINKKHLQPMLHKWDADDIKQLLVKAGFDEAFYVNEKAYAGQSRIVCSRKV